MITGLGLVPKNALSRLVGLAAHMWMPRPLARLTVSGFAKAYELNMDEAERALSEFRSVGDLFTRRLKPGARPIDHRPGFAVSPADGRVLNSGHFENGRLIQAKGRDFSLEALLKDPEAAERYKRGSWMTIYLSPQDYHRVHHPVEGLLTSARYVPGHLWPVNQAAVQRVDELFCVNERVITYVDSPLGEVATIMVGATSVGYMTMSYSENIVSNRGQGECVTEFAEPLRTARGDELGIFNLGSTAIVLFAEPDIEIEALADGDGVRMGQAIARRR